MSIGSVEMHFFSFFLDAHFQKSRKAFFLRKPFLHLEITFFLLRKPFSKSEITFKKSENRRLGDSFRKSFSARKAFLKSETKTMNDSYGALIVNIIYLYLSVGEMYFSSSH